VVFSALLSVLRSVSGKRRENGNEKEEEKGGMRPLGGHTLPASPFTKTVPAILNGFHIVPPRNGDSD
jgi:hypothetical protein